MTSRLRITVTVGMFFFLGQRIFENFLRPRKKKVTYL